MENFLRIGNIIVLVLILALFYIALDHFDYLPWNKDTEAVGLWHQIMMLMAME